MWLLQVTAEQKHKYMVALDCSLKWWIKDQIKHCRLKQLLKQLQFYLTVNKGEKKKNKKLLLMML